MDDIIALRLETDGKRGKSLKKQNRNDQEKSKKLMVQLGQVVRDLGADMKQGKSQAKNWFSKEKEILLQHSTEIRIHHLKDQEQKVYYIRHFRRKLKWAFGVALMGMFVFVTMMTAEVGDLRTQVAGLQAQAVAKDELIKTQQNTLAMRTDDIAEDLEVIKDYRETTSEMTDQLEVLVEKTEVLAQTYMLSANIQLQDRSGSREEIEPLMDSSEEIDDMIVNVAEIADWLTMEEGSLEPDRLLEIEEQLTAFMEDVPRIWPVEGRRISSVFGTRLHPILNGRSDHTGVDIPSDYGSPIVATAEGVVTYAAYSYGYGYMVKIEHANGLETVYAHASKLLVSKGDQVIQGQTIAKVGSTGLSTGPHIHYEIKINGAYIDPELFLEQ